MKRKIQNIKKISVIISITLLMISSCSESFLEPNLCHFMLRKMFSLMKKDYRRF
jgi:hypothetical protein